MYNLLTVKPTAARIASVEIQDVCIIPGANSNDQIVSISYLLNDDDSERMIPYSQLKRFTIENELNAYCIDSFAGEHVQIEGVIDADTFIVENLDQVAKCFIEANPAGAMAERRAA